MSQNPKKKRRSEESLKLLGVDGKVSVQNSLA